MKKSTIFVLACVGIYGYSVLGNDDTTVAESTTVVVSEASKAEKELEDYRNNRYSECYGNVTLAHKRNGLHERNRAQSIKIKEQICTLALTDPEITAWNKVYTEVK